MSIDVRSVTADPVVLRDRASRTVAHVDLRSGVRGKVDREAPGRSPALERAISRIEQTVRPGDRICPYGLSRVAIAFGPDAEAVLPRTLGERLARAIGQGLLPAGGAGDRPGSSSTDAGRPLAADRAATRARRTRVGTIPSTTIVTVDRLLRNLTAGQGRAVGAPLALNGDSPGTRVPVPPPRLRHRTVVRYSTMRLAGYGTRHDDRSPHHGTEHARGTVLVIDPSPPNPRTPGMAAVAACSSAERLGFKAGVISQTADDDLILDIEGVGLDLVVLVVGAEPASERTTWPTSSWCVPTQLAGAYRSRGVAVLAVSAGAGAGALAGCFEQGASVLFDLDELPAELRGFASTDVATGAWAAQSGSRDVPPRMEALMKLTASERRVLFFLTMGRSAQDMAVDLVVSLTTVRSHIRSILRKLGVRSQLAAVAMANSRDLGREPASTAS